MIAVSLRTTVDGLRLQIADDGRGFDPAAVQRGIGMHSMTERVEALGGALEIRSTPGAGTVISATLPTPQLSF